MTRCAPPPEARDGAPRLVAGGWPAGVVEARLALDALMPPADEAGRRPLPSFEHWPDAAQWKHPPRAWSYVAGRLCAHAALAHAGLASARCVVGRSGDGVPTWPAGWRGSISHDAVEAIALVAPARLVDALGVDVEPLADEHAFRSILDVCLTEAERAGLPSSTQIARFEATLRFSAKESYFKAVYPQVNRYVDFLEAEVHDIDLARGTFRVVPLPQFAQAGGPVPLLAMEGRFERAADRVVTRVAQVVRDTTMSAS